MESGWGCRTFLLSAGEHITPPALRTAQVSLVPSAEGLLTPLPGPSWTASRSRLPFSFNDRLWTPPFRSGASPLHQLSGSTGHWRFKLLLGLDLPGLSSAYLRKTRLSLRAIETLPRAQSCSDHLFPVLSSFGRGEGVRWPRAQTTALRLPAYCHLPTWNHRSAFDSMLSRLRRTSYLQRCRS